MAIRSFDLTPEVDEFIAGEVERGAYKDANEVLAAALSLLEQEQEDQSWKMFALEQAIAEGDASGFVEGDVFEQIRSERRLRHQEKIVLG